MTLLPRDSGRETFVEFPLSSWADVDQAVPEVSVISLAAFVVVILVEGR